MSNELKVIFKIELRIRSKETIVLGIYKLCPNWTYVDKPLYISLTAFAFYDTKDSLMYIVPLIYDILLDSDQRNRIKLGGAAWTIESTIKDAFG